ncbi:hypothetical protein BV378_05740 [Nostoc sp. RF31YmG]|nr:hypothetical protein BV378_05740 [Nostoc sp. RF31YmG]
MTNNVLTAREFREILRSRISSKINEASTDSEADIALLECLESDYEAAKSKLSRLLAEGASESLVKGTRITLFIISVGLFAFGRLDAAEDILENIPGGLSPVNHLSGVLNRLLPLPPGFSSRQNPTAIKEWLKIKRSQLKWNSELERYNLENFRILPIIPANSTPKIFSATDHKTDQERLLVEILPDTGINWLASFQPGFSEFSGVYQHPNRIDLIIIARGQAYIINPENKNLIDTFGGNIISVIDGTYQYIQTSYQETNIASSFILFVNNSHLLCYNYSGLLWQNIEIQWDSVRKLKLEHSRLMGECCSLESNSWLTFWLNIKTGEFHQGEFTIQQLLPKKT